MSRAGEALRPRRFNQRKSAPMMKKNDEHDAYQQQRVAIARAVAPKPSILLLDEPFSNLDAHLRQSIREELNGILKDTGMTSIFVTHDREDAKSIADQVVILDKGETIGKGKAIII
ncbi:MAG: ATP-binding cassette domain-containing protein [Desulfosporosinus sp.]|nr:ATP-binding cassette domain-containing protein [Desulfosporosinus sp.]MDA8220999.1 ATP-binding cassette domain-containing protein [Desulfitobacterium hafniense]